jgi:hypothetical protein
MPVEETPEEEFIAALAVHSRTVLPCPAGRFP